MTKILFLDFDGVLNWAKCRWRWDGTTNRRLAEGEIGGMFGIDPEKVALVNDIIVKTGCIVVISSTWRLSDDWADAIRQAGFDTAHARGVTPHLPRSGGREARERGHEIAAWFKDCLKHGVEFNEGSTFAILDDDSDMLESQMPHFFQTRWDTGLTREIADRVITHLNTPAV